MQKASRILFICGAVLTIVDALIMFITSFVFFSAASASQNGQPNIFGDMSATAISSVAIAFLVLSFVSAAAGIMCIFSLRFRNKIYYILAIVFSFIAGLAGPGIVGGVLALIDEFTNPNKNEQPNKTAQE